MDKYRYEGPVSVFGRCVDNNWKAETMAVSEKKARNNLRYQYSKQVGKIPATRVELPGKIMIVN